MENKSNGVSPGTKKLHLNGYSVTEVSRHLQLIRSKTDVGMIKCCATLVESRLDTPFRHVAACFR